MLVLNFVPRSLLSFFTRKVDLQLRKCNGPRKYVEGNYNGIANGNNRRNKSISKYAKLQQFDAVIKPECLYVKETLVFNRRTDLIEIQNRKKGNYKESIRDNQHRATNIQTDFVVRRR